MHWFTGIQNEKGLTCVNEKGLTCVHSYPVGYDILFHLHSLFEQIANIGIAPITHMRNKNSNIQGRSLNVVKGIFNTIRNCS